MTIEADAAPPARQPRHRRSRVGGAPLDEAQDLPVATNDFLSRGGDGYTMFADKSRLLPDHDAPLLANEVMVYIRGLGTVNTGVRGTDRAEVILRGGRIAVGCRRLRTSVGATARAVP